MNTKILLPFAAVALLALAACSNPETPAEPAATTEEVAPAVEVVPAQPAMAPAAEAVTITPEQAMQAVQAQAASMTPAQKTEAIALARKTAEDAATAQGLTAEQIKQAGDMAEQAAKEMFGVQ